jgi:outer membrane protein assembly factor BamE (lipoprotein component of BamABCDE complex)
MVRAASFTAALALIVGASACAPVHEQHGWIADSQSQVDIKPGVDTKSTVLARMGTPSTNGFLDANDWYYITTLQKSYAFYKPKTQARQVMVVRFGANDTVAGIDKYGLEKGRVIAYNADKTPTRGRELSILEQLLGNVGTNPFPTDERTGNSDRR